MATRIGLEPTTPSVTGWCSNQLSYRAMIAQVRAASYRGNVLYYIEKSACCQAQICRKCNFLQKRAGWAVWRRQNDFKWSPRCSDHIQRKDYFKFRVWSDRVCAAIKAPVGLLSGRAVCVSRWRGFAPTSSAERSKRIFTGGAVTEAAAAFLPYTVKRGCCAKCCATAPVVLCYIFSGTLILNMVSTLKMTFFTPMHRARRACCTAGSAP